MQINKLVFIAVAIFASACNKSSNNPPTSESTDYTLGIDKNNGDVRIFKDISKDKDFLLYNGHNLIHKNQVKPIKKYSNLKHNASSTEIEELSRLYQDNEFKIAANKQTRNPKTDPLCIKKGARPWMCNLVSLAINTSNMPKGLRHNINEGINTWSQANQNLIFNIIEVEDGDEVPPGTTVIKFLPLQDKLCTSTVGSHPNNEGIVYFSEHCDIVDVTHNIGHVLGYVDENVRPKSLNYIDINYDAIATISEQIDALHADILWFSLGLQPVIKDDPAFDRHSIMMISPYASAPFERVLLLFEEPAIYSKIPPGDLTRNVRLSAEDVRRINKVYPKIDDDELRSTCK
ncbi:MAG: M12 family metallopeptidase [Solitalea-like symbiont of Acarus siro]